MSYVSVLFPAVKTHASSYDGIVIRASALPER